VPCKLKNVVLKTLGCQLLMVQTGAVGPSYHLFGQNDIEDSFCLISSNYKIYKRFVKSRKH